MVKIVIINGDAGTGKSHKLSKYINNAKINNKSFIALAYTHSAINNLYNIYCSDFPNEPIEKDYFKTIHSYFHIDTTTNKILSHAFDNVEYMFIDEYSLISVQLVDIIKNIIKSHVNKLILCGDYKQLKTIDAKENIEYDKLEKYFNDLKELNKNAITAIKHFDNSILSTDFIKNNIANIVMLNVCLRSNEKIKNMIKKICFDEYNEEFIKNNICCLSTAIDKIKRENYTFIASKYKYLQRIHNMLNDGEDTINIIQNNLPSSYGLSTLHLIKNEYITITENFTESGELFTNGDKLKFIDYNSNFKSMTLYNEELNKYSIIHPIAKNEFNKIIKIDNIKCLGMVEENVYVYFPVVPENLITFHKSQGRTLKKVIICLNSLFDFAMLYTGLSRAAEDVLLCSVEEGNKTELKNINSVYSYLNTLVKCELLENHKIINK